MKSFLTATWRDIREFPSRFIMDRDALAVTSLTLFPWLLALVRSRNFQTLQPLIWIFAFLAFYWLIGHQRSVTSPKIRKPRLELFVALFLVVVWIIYRIGEYWHWYPVPTFGLENRCGPISETPLPKTIEMFLLPLLFLLISRYSLGEMGFGVDKFSWLVAVFPMIGLLAIGYLNHNLKTFATSFACYFFGAGLPEEFLFRAFLQTRLEAILRHPLWSIWLAAFLFGLSHVPINMAGNLNNWQSALLTAFTYQMMIGFALGYAYRVTRNFLPLSIIHTLIDFVF